MSVICLPARPFSNSVNILSGTTVVGTPITVGINPQGIAYNPNNGYMYVENSGGGGVSLV